MLHPAKGKLVSAFDHIANVKQIHLFEADSATVQPGFVIVEGAPT